MNVGRNWLLKQVHCPLLIFSRPSLRHWYVHMFNKQLKQTIEPKKIVYRYQQTVNNIRKMCDPQTLQWSLSLLQSLFFVLKETSFYSNNSKHFNGSRFTRQAINPHSKRLSRTSHEPATLLAHIYFYSNVFTYPQRTAAKKWGSIGSEGLLLKAFGLIEFCPKVLFLAILACFCLKYPLFLSIQIQCHQLQLLVWVYVLWWSFLEEKEMLLLDRYLSIVVCRVISWSPLRVVCCCCCRSIVVVWWHCRRTLRRRSIKCGSSTIFQPSRDRNTLAGHRIVSSVGQVLVQCILVCRKHFEQRV